ncbi:MAG: hypothetical protein RMK29_05405 [Myxococcales bacterium]|nr:hypothetical protein [Myxococcales bacterium]
MGAQRRVSGLLWVPGVQDHQGIHPHRGGSDPTQARADHQ